ncbi:MAG: hypothetical protein AAF802_32855 [Planctomycetota bacterium]
MHTNKSRFEVWKRGILFGIILLHSGVAARADEQAPADEMALPEGMIDSAEFLDSSETLAELLTATTITESENGSVAAEEKQTSRSWLDIRPRGINTPERTLVARDQLPLDESGLPPLEDISWAVQIHAADLTYADLAYASSHRYRPLYFEDRLLERYGSITGVLKHCPPLHATAQFAVSSATLPISAIKYPVCRDVGTGQPSRCEPRLEAGAIIGHVRSRQTRVRASSRR